jgi:hypothetical protein
MHSSGGESWGRWGDGGDGGGGGGGDDGNGWTTAAMAEADGVGGVAAMAIYIKVARRAEVACAPLAGEGGAAG